MNFNYETKGIDIDLGGIASMMNARTTRDAAKAEEAALEAKRARDKQFADAYTKFSKLRNQGKNGTAAFREMVKIDATKAKTAYDMDTQLEQDAKQRVADMVYEAKVLADNGRIGDARNVIIQRKHLLDQYGSSSQFTSPLALAAQNADDLSMLKLLDSASNTAEAMGLIEPPDKEGLKSVGTFNDEKGQQYVMFQRPDGTFKREYTGDSRQAEIEQERGKSAARNQGGIDYSKEQESRISSYSDAAVQKRRSADAARRIAQNYTDVIATEGWDALRQGIGAEGLEALKSLTGTQDPVSFIRLDAKRFTNKEVVSNLPPGVASDRDVQLVLNGFPPSTANAEEYARWLNGYAKLKQAEAMEDELIAEFTEATGGVQIARGAGQVFGKEVKAGERFADFKTRLYDDMKKKADKEARFQAREAELEAQFSGQAPEEEDEFSGFSIVK